MADGSAAAGAGGLPEQAPERYRVDQDLAARWLSGTVVAASDQGFGDKENLLNVGEPHFEPGRYDQRGEIVDGWETRRRRTPGHDWAIVRLGTPGVIKSIDVDTRFFTGNYPPSCSIDACGREGYPDPAELQDARTEWVEIVPRSPLRGDTHNWFEINSPLRFTHVRLHTFPDGGVARLRVHGRVIPDPRDLDGVTVDLAGPEVGGLVAGSSDDFYTSAQMLNRPDRPRTMGEGWMARRLREPGHDHVVFRLGVRGAVRRLIIDTAYFRYNASAECTVSGCDTNEPPPADSTEWRPILKRTPLQPDTRHVFRIAGGDPVSLLRLDVYPDGGLSRFHVIGSPDAGARGQAGRTWFNALPAAQAREVLAASGIDALIADAVASARPLPDGWHAEPGSRVAPEATVTWDQDALQRLRALLDGPESRSLG